MRWMVAPLFLFVAASAFAQHPRGPTTRVPPGAPRFGTAPSPIAQLAGVHPERQTSGKPFVGPVPFPSESSRWIRLETPHFLIISSAGERRTRTIAKDIERLTATLTSTSTHFCVTAERTHVFLFTQHGDVQPYFDAARGFSAVDASGLTVREVDRSTILIDANTRGGAWLTPRHELIHVLLGRGGRPFPLWLEEGLAEYYSNSGQPVREHVSLLSTRLKMPLETLFTIDLGSPRAGSFYFYAKSWAVVSTLIRRDESGFFAFVDDVAHGATVTAALQMRYNMSLAQLEGAIRGCGMPASMTAQRKVNVPMVIQDIDRAELLRELGRLLAAVPGRRNEADRHFAAAASSDISETTKDATPSRLTTGRNIRRATR